MVGLEGIVDHLAEVGGQAGLVVETETDVPSLSLADELLHGFDCLLCRCERRSVHR